MTHAEAPQVAWNGSCSHVASLLTYSVLQMRGNRGPPQPAHAVQWLFRSLEYFSRDPLQSWQEVISRENPANFQNITNLKKRYWQI